MKKFFVITLITFVANLVSVSAINAESPPYPEPPSDEQKAKWKELGDENLEKYGSGTSQPVGNTQAVQPTLAPTTLPTATTTPTLEPTKQLTEPPTIIPVQDSNTDNQQSSSLWQSILNWWKNLFNFGG